MWLAGWVKVANPGQLFRGTRLGGRRLCSATVQRPHMPQGGHAPPTPCPSPSLFPSFPPQLLELALGVKVGTKDDMEDTAAFGGDREEHAQAEVRVQGGQGGRLGGGRSPWAMGAGAWGMLRLVLRCWGGAGWCRMVYMARRARTTAGVPKDARYGQEEAAHTSTSWTSCKLRLRNVSLEDLPVRQCRPPMATARGS